MAKQQEVTFDFPDPDATDDVGAVVEMKDDSEQDTSLEVEGAVGRTQIDLDTKPKKPEEKQQVKPDAEVEIEVKDDTPEKDRGRKPSEPPKDVTDEELESYSEKVRQRIKHFSKGYHDERRAKEAEQRQRAELEAYAKQLLEENQRLKGSVTQSQNTMVETAKKQAEKDLEWTRTQLKAALEAGDPDTILKAQEEFNSAHFRKARLDAYRPPKEETAPTKENALQPEKDSVQQAPIEQAAPQVDPKAQAWHKNNQWFGTDERMTAHAWAVHADLKAEGIDPRSDDYYERLDAGMREKFPVYFDDGIDTEIEEPKAKQASVVAPVSRSVAPKKITLTKSQVAIAKRLGVPLEQYAKEVASLRNRHD